MKGWRKIFHANRDQKKAGVAIFISDKTDFKAKAVKRDKEGHYTAEVQPRLIQDIRRGDGVGDLFIYLFIYSEI